MPYFVGLSTKGVTMILSCFCCKNCNYCWRDPKTKKLHCGLNSEPVKKSGWCESFEESPAVNWVKALKQCSEEGEEWI